MSGRLMSSVAALAYRRRIVSVSRPLSATSTVLTQPRRLFASPSKGGIPTHPDGPAVSSAQQASDIGELLDHADMNRPPVQWADYRPNLVEVEVTRNADGDLEGVWDNETVVFPELETSLEWVLSTPVDEHLFEEVPIIKECPDDEDTV